VRADDRPGLEGLARYVLRPPVARDRLALTPEGQVLVTLKAEWADGTTHLLFEPIELLMMRRVFDLDVLVCPRCGGRMSVIATTEAKAVVQKILRHLSLPTDRRRPSPLSSRQSERWLARAIRVANGHGMPSTSENRAAEAPGRRSALAAASPLVEGCSNPSRRGILTESFLKAPL
jgi:uncharacterized protein YbaR (Trm112 family)